jgi:hypothetical protein
MTAIVVTALFAIAALLAVSTLVNAWNACRYRFTALKTDLKQVERGVSVRYARYDTGPRAVVYHLRFTGQAADRPGQRQPELCEAA